MRRFVLTALALATLAALAGCVRPVPVDQVELLAPETRFEHFKATFVEVVLFGYWRGEPFSSDWIESRDVPDRPGLNFGWRIKLKQPHAKFVRIIERLTAPRPPATWGPLTARHLVSADGLVATVPNSLKVRDDWIHRANWRVSDGDPLGEYHLEIQVNGSTAARLAFRLIEDTAPPDEPEEIEDELPDDLPADDDDDSPEGADDPAVSQ